MRKILTLMILTMAAVSLSGCGCNRSFGRWFNRGDACEPRACVEQEISATDRHAVLQRLRER